MKRQEKKQWFMIEYETKTSSLVAYFELTWSDFTKKLSKFESRYNVTYWCYCDNPYK